MNKRESILIGFFPKITARADAWFSHNSFEEVCSVSNCISAAPADWIKHWKHNTTWWLFDTETIAWSIVENESSTYDMYAYKLFPVIFDGKNESQIKINTTASGNLSAFNFLGYDIVSRESGALCFCHSPLSCNRGCDRFPVNRYCLIGDLSKALGIIRIISNEDQGKGAWEPGPYYLCEVYRKEKGSPLEK